jgi:4-diphosphocytidyl-2-C-methyl-D-erythritol kinase
MRGFFSVRDRDRDRARDRTELRVHLNNPELGSVTGPVSVSVTNGKKSRTWRILQKSFSQAMQLFSPAKINLFLRILGKRPDGYHEIASLFQAIDLGDTLTIDFAKEERLTCSDPTLACDGTNLVLKAVNLFRRKTGLRFSVDIHLEKNIPTQAGLGGGSSNAATTLWALNALHHHSYSEQELQTWSAEIGSDIPFFFSHGTAYCTGRGECVRDLPPIPDFTALSVIKPKEGLSTPAIYQALNLGECSSEDPQTLLAHFYSGRPVYINDLEKPALRLCPPLANLKKKLHLEGNKTLFMTGSGTALVSPGNGIRHPINRPQASWYDGALDFKP